MNLPSDLSILEDLRSEDTRRQDQAFTQIYRAYFPLIRAYVNKNSGSAEEAKDIFQDTLVVFFKQLREGLEISHSIRAYLYSIARNRWLHTLRGTRPTQDVEDAPEVVALTDDSMEVLAREERAGVLAKLVDSLGERCQELLRLFYFDKAAFKVIQERLGLTSEGQAKTQKYRCLQQLRELVKKNSEILTVLRDQ